MFGKEIRPKLPGLRPEKSLCNESMKEKDWEQKLKQNQRSQKPPSGRPGEADFSLGQVTFSPFLPTGKSPGKTFADQIFDNDFEKKG